MASGIRSTRPAREAHPRAPRLVDLLAEVGLHGRGTLVAGNLEEAVQGLAHELVVAGGVGHGWHGSEMDRIPVNKFLAHGSK
jgi:hypothetical protein